MRSRTLMSVLRRATSSSHPSGISPSKNENSVGLNFVRNLEQGKRTLRMDKVNQLLDLFDYELIPARKDSPDKTEP